MRLRSAGLLLLLLSGLQADAQEKEVRAIVGSDVKLSCIHTEERSFDLNELHVYWQISVPGNNKPKTVTFYLAGNSSVGHANNQYQDRAEMSLDGMKQGDFSLHLHNITPQDEQKFNCLVFRNLKRVLEVMVSLHVAANYSMPVVSTPSSTPEDKELIFTCTSTDGYPRPNVYWINKTDNSVLDEALQNNTVSLNARGLYDVVSVLRIRQTPNVNVGCCIENVLLHQNLTVSTQQKPETFTGNHRETPGDTHTGTSTAVVAGVTLLLIVAVAVAMAAGWWCRSRCPRWGYAGTQASRPELEFTDHV